MEIKDILRNLRESNNLTPARAYMKQVLPKLEYWKQK